MMLTWGLLAMTMVLVKTPAHLYLARFLLGMAEAGFFPGVAFYLTRRYPAAMRARAISRFYISGPLAAMGIATVTTMGILGGFAGPAWMGWMKDLTGSYQLGLMSLAFPCLVAASIVLNLRHSTVTGRKELVVKERFHA